MDYSRFQKLATKLLAKFGRKTLVTRAPIYSAYIDDSGKKIESVSDGDEFEALTVVTKNDDKEGDGSRYVGGSVVVISDSIMSVGDTLTHMGKTYRIYEPEIVAPDGTAIVTKSKAELVK